MNFFGVGPLELTLVGIIAIVVLGPERIPEVAVQLARGIRFLRGFATDSTAQMRSELNELMKEYDEVRKELSEVRESVSKNVSSVADEVGRTMREGQAMIEPAGEPPPAEKGADTSIRP